MWISASKCSAELSIVLRWNPAQPKCCLFTWFTADFCKWVSFFILHKRKISFHTDFFISVSWQHVSSQGCIWGKRSSEPVFSCQGDEPWRGEWKQPALCTVQQLSDSVHSEVLLMEEAVSLSSLVCWNPVRHKCSPFSLQTILTWDGARLSTEQI